MTAVKTEIKQAGEDDKTTVKFYSSLRYDINLIFWVTSENWEKVLTFRVFLEKTFGDAGAIKYGFLSVCEKPASANTESKYFVAYPMKKSPEWYLLPENERKELTSEHIAIAKSSNDKNILSYTTRSFGISDEEFLVIYEVPSLHDWTRVVENLRYAKSRRWIIKEEPVLVGIDDEGLLYLG